MPLIEEAMAQSLDKEGIASADILARDDRQYSSGIEDDGLDQENITDPFNPEDVDIATQANVISQMLDRIERGYRSNPSGYINLAPEFQRNSGIWTLSKKSQLIESILLGIPLPMFYVSARRSGEWDVVDGIQRLGVLRDFVLGAEYLKSLETGATNEKLKGKGFKLTGLEFLQQFEEKTFKDLPNKQKDDILGCNVQVTVIKAGTPEQVKFNIFRRINTGGMPLTNQEVRHALHQGAATRFLQRLVQNKIFAAATDKSVNDARMEGRELLLRVIVHFLLPLNDKISKIDIENEMNKAMRVLNHIGGTPEKSKEPLPVYNPYTLDALEALIIQGLSRAATLFSDYAFRKAVPPNKRTPINKALFETWTSCLGEIPEENWERLMGNIARFRNDAWGLLQDPVFLDTVGNRGYLTRSIQHRYASVRAIIDNNLKG